MRERSQAFPVNSLAELLTQTRQIACVLKDGDASLLISTRTEGATSKQGACGERLLSCPAGTQQTSARNGGGNSYAA